MSTVERHRIQTARALVRQAARDTERWSKEALDALDGNPLSRVPEERLDSIMQAVNRVLYRIHQLRV